MELKVVKSTCMPNPVECLGYIEYYISSSSDLLKAIAILSDTNVRRSAVNQEDLHPYWKSEKGHISLGDYQEAYCLQVFQRLY